MEQVATLFQQVFTACMSWFYQLLSETGGTGWWLSALLMYMSYKAILAPLFGYAHSDTVKKSYNAFKRGKED